MSRNIPSVDLNNYAAIFTKPIFKNQNGEWYRDVGYVDSLDIIRENFQGAAKSFIAIGYYLKHIKENELYKEGNYQDIWECAQAEFGLSQAAASRYMSMNDAFSKNGDTPLLDDKYSDFNKSQLQEMLSLPEAKREEITPEQTVREIREIAVKERQMNEPTEKNIKTFYEKHVKEYDVDRSKLKELLIEKYGKSHMGSCSSDFDCTCSPRGVSFGNADEITWAQFVKKVNEYFPLEEKMQNTDNDSEILAKIEEMGIPETSEQVQEQIPGQLEIHDFPEYLPDMEEIATTQCLSAYGLPKSEYPADSLIKQKGCGNMHDCFFCAMDCEIRGEERYCIEAPMGNPFSCIVMQSLHDIRDEMGESCQFIETDKAYHRSGDHAPSPCCISCDNKKCDYRCSRSCILNNEEEKNTGSKHAEFPTIKTVTPQGNIVVRTASEIIISIIRQAIPYLTESMCNGISNRIVEELQLHNVRFYDMSNTHTSEEG